MISSQPASCSLLSFSANLVWALYILSLVSTEDRILNHDVLLNFLLNFLTIHFLFNLKLIHDENSKFNSKQLKLILFTITEFY